MTESKTGTIGLAFAWGLRLQLRAKGDKRWGAANRLWGAADRLRREEDRLRREGDKLTAESCKLWAEGDKLWAKAIHEAYGNITLRWEGKRCILGTGEIFGP